MIDDREPREEQQPDPHHLQWLGTRLREARDDAGASQEEVCSRLGFATRSLARWEHGEVAPAIDTVVALAETYGVSLDWLTGRTSIRQVLHAGQVLVDEHALAAVRAFAASGKKLEDLPQGLVRKPGVQCAFVVPEKVLLLRGEAADAIEAEMQQLVVKMGRRRS